MLVDDNFHINLVDYLNSINVFKLQYEDIINIEIDDDIIYFDELYNDPNEYWYQYRLSGVSIDNFKKYLIKNRKEKLEKLCLR